MMAMRQPALPDYQTIVYDVSRATCVRIRLGNGRTSTFRRDSIRGPWRGYARGLPKPSSFVVQAVMQALEAGLQVSFEARWDRP